MGKNLVLEVRATNFFGGPERQILAQAARGRNFSHHVVTFAEGRAENELAMECRKRGVPVSVIPSDHPFSPGQILKLRGVIRETGAKVVCTHGYKPAVLASLAVPGTGARLLPFARGHTRENAKVALFEGMERRVMRHSRIVVAVSEGYAEYLAGMGVPRERLRVVRNAIDPKAFTAGVPGREEARRLLGLTGDGPLIVTAGRLSPEKGHKDLLQAIALLSGRVPGARLSVLGAGPMQGELEAEARDRALSQVVFHGFRKDAPLFYSAMDLFVLPSRTEGLPNVLLEAFAFARPVAATAVGGVAEVVEDGVSGLVVPAGRPELLSAAMEKILLSPGRGASLGEAGLAGIRERFSFAVQAEALERVYAEALAV
ncbi:MAG: glycosyltransferase [Thermodesulfobacteriota bacterium]